VPAARWLVAHGHQVTGVDISPIQIERARRLVPRATFRCSDVTELDFPDDSFDAIVSFFAIIHVPVEEQPALFQRIGRWLRPDGWFMATLGTQHWTGTEENWLSAGAPMYWSHADADTYRQWIREAGLLAELERFIPEETGGHNLILAHKPHSREPA
jgi:SAM-dependent methyltransferase